MYLRIRYRYSSTVVSSSSMCVPCSVVLQLGVGLDGLRGSGRLGLRGGLRASRLHTRALATIQGGHCRGSSDCPRWGSRKVALNGAIAYADDRRYRPRAHPLASQVGDQLAALLAIKPHRRRAQRGRQVVGPGREAERGVGAAGSRLLDEQAQLLHRLAGVARYELDALGESLGILAGKRGGRFDGHDAASAACSSGRSRRNKCPPVWPGSFASEARSPDAMRRRMVRTDAPTPAAYSARVR